MKVVYAANDFDDLPRYRKKAKKKTPAKADHKHEFVNCVYEIDTERLDPSHGFVTDTRFSIGTYCRVCGKIGTHFDRSWRDSDPVPSWCRMFCEKWSARAEAEFNEATRTLPLFRIHDLFKQKYVERKEVQT